MAYSPTGTETQVGRTLTVMVPPPMAAISDPMPPMAITPTTTAPQVLTRITQVMAPNSRGTRSSVLPKPGAGFGQTGVQKDSFFGALFDFSFTKYATPSVVKAVYILAMVGIGFFLFIGVIALLIGLTQDGGAFGLLLLPLLVVGGLFYLAMIRVGLEVSTAIIRTSQSVQSIDERQAREETSGQSYSGPFGG
nr:DUF4282 domain-containing protein [Corynebacterium auriscanis]